MGHVALAGLRVLGTLGITSVVAVAPASATGSSAVCASATGGATSGTCTSETVPCTLTAELRPT